MAGYLSCQVGHSSLNTPSLCGHHSLYVNQEEFSGNETLGPYETILKWLKPENGLNDCIREKSSFYSDVADSCSAGSRPSSTHVSENELCNIHDSLNVNNGDPTYLLSLPNSTDWTLAHPRTADQNQCVASSPVSCNYGDSRFSPVTPETSFYDVFQTLRVLEVPNRDRKTPPPPYRPPVEGDVNCHFAQYGEMTRVNVLPLERLMPPPPYSKTESNKKRTNRRNSYSKNIGLSSAVPLRTFQNNSPLTADEALASSNMWAPPSPAESDSGSSGIPGTAAKRTVTEVRVPGDPAVWNKDHICHWLTQVENYYGINRIDRTHMPEDGETLCNMSVEDFQHITGNDRIADILGQYLNYLKQNARLSSEALAQNTAVYEKNRATFFDSIKQFIGKSPDSNSSPGGGGGQIQLWQFLLDLLTDANYSSIIAWEGDDGVFRLIDPEGTARLWGARKSKLKKTKKKKSEEAEEESEAAEPENKMNYDKLSRSLRYYYMKGIINKVEGRRYTYKFHLDGLMRACSPSGISDSMFINPNLELNRSDNISPRNFNLNIM